MLIHYFSPFILFGTLSQVGSAARIYARDSPTTKALLVEDQPPKSSTQTPLPSFSVAPSNHLLPSVHPDQDTHAIGNLQPSTNSTLYYEAKTPSVQKAAAFVTFTELLYNTVALEHVHGISTPNCDGTTLTINFSRSKAFQYASSTWPGTVTSGLVFITHFPSCGSGYPAERAWLLVNSIQVSQSDLSLSASYTEIALQDAAKIIEVNYGNITTPGNLTSSSSIRQKPTSILSHKSSSTSSRFSSTASGRKSTLTTSISKTSSHSSTHMASSSSISKKSSSNSATSSHHASLSTSALKVSSTSKHVSSSSSSQKISTTSSHSSSPSSFGVSTSSGHSLSSAATSSKVLASSSHSLSSPSSFTKLPLTSIHSSSLTSSKLPNRSSLSSSSSSSSWLSTSSKLSSSSSSSSQPSTISKLSSSPSSLKSSTLVQTSSSSLFSSSTSGFASPSTSPVADLDFDINLDNEIGYLDPTSSGFWPQLLPGVPASNYPQFGSPQRKRTFDIGALGNSLVTSASEAISNSITILQNTVTNAVNTASKAYLSTVNAATQAAIALLNSLSPFSLGPWPFNLSPSTYVDTPFGGGTVIAESSKTSQNGVVTGELTAYCVECSVSGSFTLNGNFVFDVQQGIITSYLDLNGYLYGALLFGLVGEVTASDQWSTNLVTQGLPGLSITNIITIGPYVTVDVGATSKFSLQGAIEYGWYLDWPYIDASIDLVNPLGTIQASGLQPYVYTVTDFSEAASMAASVFSTVALRFGINILSGKYTVDVGLVNKPEGDLNAIQQIYSHHQLEDLADGTVVCGGVGADFELIDSVYIEAEFGGAKKSQNTTKTYPLTSWTIFSTSTCYGKSTTISHASSQSSGPSAVPSSYCGILQDPPDNDEPDDDGDEITTCVTGADATLLATTFGSAYYAALSSEAAATYSPVTCDPSLDPVAFGACEYNVQLQAQQFEDEVFGLGLKRRAPASPVAPMTPPPVFPTPAIEKNNEVMKRQGTIAEVKISVLNATVPTTLSWADDGNLIVDGDSTRSNFSSINNYIIGDGSGNRLLHIYNDTLASLGVSRLRLATLDAMPLQSVLVTLIPIQVAKGGHAYVAVTSDGAVFFMITCLLDTQFPKVFVAKNITAGAATLMVPALAGSLTGGNVTSCGYLPWGVPA